MTIRTPVESPSAGRRSAAFTLLEMLTSVSLMVVIIFGLYGIFSQTQKAFKSVSGQVDVFEGGRAAIEIIARDVAQAVPANDVGYPHFDVFRNVTINQLPFELPVPELNVTNYFTNQLQSLFLMVRNGTQWEGHGYFVHTNLNDASVLTNGFGVLYRYQVATNRINTNSPMVTRFYSANPSQTNSFVVADGVVHFTVRAFDNYGREMTNIVNGPLTGDTLPAMVELELGIMEPDMLGEARAIPAAPPQYTALTNYLGRNSGRVHLFRQQIPIRGAVR